MKYKETIGVIMVAIAVIIFIITFIDHMIIEIAARDSQVSLLDRFIIAWPFIVVILLLMPGLILIYRSRKNK